MAEYFCNVCGHKSNTESAMKEHIKVKHPEKLRSMSLRNIVRSRWLWVAVVVAWVVCFLRILQVREGPNLGLLLGMVVTLLVVLAKLLEYLTRPKQNAK